MKIATCCIGVGDNWCQGFSGGAITICWDFLFSLPPWQGIKLTHRLTQLLLLWQIGNILEYFAGVPASLEKIMLYFSPLPPTFFISSSLQCGSNSGSYAYQARTVRLSYSPTLYLFLFWDYLLYRRPSSDSLSSWGWLWTSYPPVSSAVLRL